MIKGRRKIELSAEEILKRLTPFDLYRKYFGDFKINEITFNHLRGERDGNPSFVIGNRYGELLHHDFSAGSSWSGNCFQLVQQINQCSYDEALKIIDRDFNIGIASGELGTEYKKITSQYKQPEEAGKRYSLIQVVTRKFTPLELEYWAQYYQTIEDLRANNVYSIKEVFLNRKKYSMPDDELRFGYLYEGSYWKLYFPHREKRKKWLSNVPLTTLDSKEQVKGCDVAFITKSKKDKMVLSKIYPCVTATQNESVSCFSPENVEYIKSNSKRQILMYDSDDPGVSASQQITKLFDFDYCNVPRKYLAEGINDWAGLAEKYGLKIIEKILKDKNIL